MNMVILPSGYTKEKKELVAQDVQNVLPMFMSIAVGKENGLWYVQTTDIMEETNLSYPIMEGIETKEKALLLAENISKITGMSIQEW